MSQRGQSGMRGEKHPMAKLTDAQCAEIKRRRAAGEKLAVLAVEFGVHESRICTIARRAW